MSSLQRWRRAGAVACLAAACGEAPEPPSPIFPPGAVVTGGATAGQMDVLPARPEPAPASPGGGAGSPDAGAPEVDGTPSGSVGSPRPEATAPAFVACAESRLAGCDYIYFSMQDAAADLCVQLMLDSCGSFGRGGLSVDVPLSWRLAAGSVGPAEPCELGEFDPMKDAAVISASGEITWEEQGRTISQLQVDVTVESAPTERTPDPAEIEVVTSEPLGPLPECDD